MLSSPDRRAVDQDRRAAVGLVLTVIAALGSAVRVRLSSK